MRAAALLTILACLACWVIFVATANGDAVLHGLEWIFIPAVILIGPALVAGIILGQEDWKHTP